MVSRAPAISEALTLNRMYCTLLATVVTIAVGSTAVLAFGLPQPSLEKRVYSNNLRLAAVAAAPQTEIRVVAVRRGGTLEGTLRNAGVSRGVAGETIRALSRLFDPRTLMPGQKIELRFTRNVPAKLWSVRLPLSKTRGIMATSITDGTYLARTYNPSGAEPELIAGGPLLWVEGGVKNRSLTVRKGQTLMNIALALGSTRIEADSAIRTLAQIFNVRRLQIGQEVTATFDKSSKLLSFGVSIDGDVEVIAFLSEGGEFQPLRTTIADRERFAAEAEVLRTEPNKPHTVDNQPHITALQMETLNGTVQKGDTILEIATRLGARSGEALEATQALSSLVNLRRLRVGQEVLVILGNRKDDVRTRLLALAISGQQKFT